MSLHQLAITHAVLTLATTMLLTGCEAPAPTVDSPDDAASAAVCGLLDRALLSEVFGDASYDATGTGVTGPHQRQQGIDCSIRSEKPPHIAVELNAVDIPSAERAQSQRMLTSELEEKAADSGLRCFVPEALKAIGPGYACLDDSSTGPHNLRVLASDRLISVQLNRVDLKDPVAVLIRLAANANKNIEAYDRKMNEG